MVLHATPCWLAPDLFAPLATLAPTFLCSQGREVEQENATDKQMQPPNLSWPKTTLNSGQTDAAVLRATDESILTTVIKVLCTKQRMKLLCSYMNDVNEERSF